MSAEILKDVDVAGITERLAESIVGAGNTMTEEDVKKVSDAVEAGVKDNPKVQLAEGIESGSVSVECGDGLEEGIASDDLLFSDLDDGTVGVDIVDTTIEKMLSSDEEAEVLKSGLKDTFKISDNDVLQMLDVIKRYRKNEKFSVFNALPDSIKVMVRQQIGEAAVDRANLNLFSKLMIEEFVTEILDKGVEHDIIDFQKSIQETLGSIPNIVEMYSDTIRENMEQELIKKAEEIQETNPEGAAIYRGCAKAFTDSYTFTRQREILKDGKVRRKLYKEEYAYKRYCDEFNCKNEKTQFSIRDIYKLGQSMITSIAPMLDLDEHDVATFVILFIKSCRDLDHNKTEDAMYMYYSIFNIINLEYYDGKGEFGRIVLTNIKMLFNDIWKAIGRDREFVISSTPVE